MVTLTRFARLSGIERRLLFRALAWLVVARAGLALFPFFRVHGFFMRRRAAGSPGFTPQDASWAVQAVACRIPGTRCLPRAFALIALLRGEGYASEVRLGLASNGDGGMLAHAWVVCEGESLPAGDDLLRYAPLPSLPSLPS